MRHRLAHPAQVSRPLSDLLVDWTDAGLLTDTQAAAIRAREVGHAERAIMPTTTHAASPAPSLVVEALGYLGGVVMLVGAVLLVSTFWADIPTAIRLLLIGGTAVVLITGGFVVAPDRLGDAAGRLRSVLWAAAVACSGAFFAVLSTDVMGRHTYESLVVIGPAAALIAAPLWRIRTTWLQQLAVLVPLMLTADGVGLVRSAGDSRVGGAYLWAVAMTCATGSAVRWFEPRTTGVAFGVLGATLGSLMMDDDLGIALGLATAAVTIALAISARSLPWLGVATVTLLATAPRAANQWFPGRLSASLTFILAGGLLVGCAIWVTRRRKT